MRPKCWRPGRGFPLTVDEVQECHQGQWSASNEQHGVMSRRPITINGDLGEGGARAEWACHVTLTVWPFFSYEAHLGLCWPPTFSFSLLVLMHPSIQPSIHPPIIHSFCWSISTSVHLSVKHSIQPSIIPGFIYPSSNQPIHLIMHPTNQKLSNILEMYWFEYYAKSHQIWYVEANTL